MYESYPPDPAVLTYTNGAKESKLNNGSKPACCLTGRPEGIHPSPEGKLGILQGLHLLVSSLHKTFTQQVPHLYISTQPNIFNQVLQEWSYTAIDKLTTSPSCSDSTTQESSASSWAVTRGRAAIKTTCCQTHCD